MAKPGRLAALVVLALTLLPASASACPTTRHVVHHGRKTTVEKTCVDRFKQQRRASVPASR